MENTGQDGKIGAGRIRAHAEKINVPGVQVPFTWPLALSFMRKAPYIDFIRVLEYNKTYYGRFYTVDVHKNDKSARSFETPRSYAGCFLLWRSFYGVYVYFRGCGEVECVE